jgi:hypothetical protein
MLHWHWYCAMVDTMGKLELHHLIYTNRGYWNDYCNGSSIDKDGPKQGSRGAKAKLTAPVDASLFPS